MRNTTPRRSRDTLGLLFALTTCLVSALGAALPAPETAPEPMSAEAFFRDRIYASPRVSPDGKHIASLYSSGEVKAVLVNTLFSDGSPPRVVLTFDQDELTPYWVEWVNNERFEDDSLSAAAPRLSASREEAALESAIGRGGPAVDEQWQRSSRSYGPYAPTRCDWRV